VGVVTARSPLPAGVPISGSELGLNFVPPPVAPPASYRELSQVVGLDPTRTIATGQPVLQSDLVTPAPSPIADTC